MSPSTTARVALDIRRVLQQTPTDVHANLAWRVHPKDHCSLLLECGLSGGISTPNFALRSVEIMGVPVMADIRVEELK